MHRGISTLPCLMKLRCTCATEFARSRVHNQNPLYLRYRICRLSYSHQISTLCSKPCSSSVYPLQCQAPAGLTTPNACSFATQGRRLRSVVLGDRTSCLQPRVFARTSSLDSINLTTYSDSLQSLTNSALAASLPDLSLLLSRELDSIALRHSVFSSKRLFPTIGGVPNPSV